jgi:hypothetical protein
LFASFKFTLSFVLAQSSTRPKAILAKEMFNPNYALFMSTEDGCTFQPNPNSSINPDDLRYFRFVGRIVGKAVVDGFLLDAHFTRSLYKHMLGVKPTHHDMQAIDPDVRTCAKWLALSLCQTSNLLKHPPNSPTINVVSTTKICK